MKFRLKKLICNPRQTSREQKDLGHLISMFWANWDQNIIQIYINMETFASAKEQYVFGKWSENLWGCSQPKWQNLPLKRFVLPSKI